MAREQEHSPTPASGKSIEPSPAIGPDGWEDAVITWVPDPPPESNKTWLASALAGTQVKDESIRAYSRRLFGLAGGRFKSARSIETCIHQMRPKQKP